MSSSFYRIVPELEQGTSEWLEFRKRHITGTEVAHLWSGQVKFEQLRDEKLGLVSKPQLNTEPVLEGKFFEPLIRAHLLTTPLGRKLSPSGECPTPCLEVVSEPYFMVSLDGLTDMGIPVEIKNSYSKSKTSYKDVLENGSFSKTGKNAGYYAQVQWEIYCTDAPCAVFCTHKSLDGKTFCPDNFKTQIIKRDPEVIKELVAIAHGFKEFMDTGKLPELKVGKRAITPEPQDEVVQLIELYKTQNEAYEAANAALKPLKEQRDETAKLLVELLPEGVNKLETSDCSIVREERKGSIDVEELSQYLVEHKLMSVEQIDTFRRDASYANRIRLK